ncbi:MAG: hypothetical protein RJA70_256 [Pseudomonadota bacterium]|jgi:hypothetical protein
MDTNVRRTALRAAAKLAFGAAFLSACGRTGDDSTLSRHPIASRTETDKQGPNNRSDAGLSGQTQSTSTGEHPAIGYSPHGRDGGATVDPAPNKPGSDAQAASGLACVEHVELTLDNAPTTPEPDALSCCRAYNNQRIADNSVDAGNLEASYPALAADESFVNCCRVIINAGTSPGADTLWASCCAAEVHGFDQEGQNSLWQHSYCTPWGPAVPPSMDYVARGGA